MKSVLVPVNSQMTGIRSRVNKYYTIQFNIKYEKGNFPVLLGQDVLFLVRNVILNDLKLFYFYSS